MKFKDTKWWKWVVGSVGALIAGGTIMLGGVIVGNTAISQLVGLAVAQSTTLWNNVIDAAKGDAQTNGILATALFSYNGTTFDRLRGSIANGILVDVTRVTGNVSVVGTASDNITNSTAKLPVIPCRANASAPAWTEGFMVPCSTDLSGGMRIAGGGSSSPVEGTTLLNFNQNSAANTANVVTLTGAANTRVHLYKISRASCSVGTADIVVFDGAVGLWGTFSNEVPQSPASLSETWPVGITGTTGNTITITLSACGTGGISTISVEADRF